MEYDDKRCVISDQTTWWISYMILMLWYDFWISYNFFKDSCKAWTESVPHVNTNNAEHIGITAVPLQ